jgi:DMSO/TMAO reductase YedYZ molybdopterin-dependent catalytic subunit
VGRHRPRSGRTDGTLDVGRKALPHDTPTTDIHCVTKWSKLDSVWEGVSVDTLLAEALARSVEPAPYVLAVSDGSYTTTLPLADVTRGKACVAVKRQR